MLSSFAPTPLDIHLADLPQGGFRLSSDCVECGRPSRHLVRAVVAGHGGLLVATCDRHTNGRSWSPRVAVALFDRFVWCHDNDFGADWEPIRGVA